MMLNSFENMPDHSRLWVYQSDRSFTDEEVEEARTLITNFIENWKAHGKDLAGSFKIFHNQFFVLAVDESYNMASGCSIDESVGLVKQLENQFGTQLMNRTNVAFQVDGEIVLFPLKEIKEKILNGEIEKTTPIFNNFVQTLGDFKASWTLPAEKSWAARFFS